MYQEQVEYLWNLLSISKLVISWLKNNTPLESIPLVWVIYGQKHGV